MSIMDRLERLRMRMVEKGLPAFMVTHPANRRYLSGFTGSSGTLIVTEKDQHLFTDTRYEEAACAEAPHYKLTIYRREREFKELLSRLLARSGIHRLACEAAHLTMARHRLLEENLEGVELVPVEGVVEHLRQVKEEEEVRSVRRAVALAERAFSELLPEVAPGRSERDLALELEFRMRRLGAERAAFDLIVASGPRSSLPHGHPGERRLEAGDLVVFDFGAVFGGYCSDLTRTVIVGRADSWQEEVYNIVLAAHRAGLDAVRGGIAAGVVDLAARTVIEEAGYGDHFGHGTGHGVGLEVHEEPRLAPGREDQLVPGMLVTIEPGIYLPERGGVRIEDTVLVTEGGCESLCTLAKELMVL